MSGLKRIGRQIDFVVAMFDFIDLWKEWWDKRKRRKRTLKDIKEAKQVYDNHIKKAHVI